MGNNFKTAFLLTALTLFLIFLGGVIGGHSRIGASNGMVLAFVIAAAMNFSSYFFSDRLAKCVRNRAKSETRVDRCDPGCLEPARR
jgi:heat shock protein HtpX